MTREWPKRLAGLATLPMQDVKAAIEELERAVTRLGLKGAELDTNVNGAQWDEQKFLPFFKAAEAMGAVLFFHPQPQNNFLMQRNPRHGLSNSLGVLLDDAIVTATLICGGVLEACPDLRACIAHGGGPACFAMGRLDRNWHGRPDARSIPQPPSVYERRLYYDTVASSEEALRFLIDRVGVDTSCSGATGRSCPGNPDPAAGSKAWSR
jgi:aminocarboxymuconate-semialdehyde decarboxylase